MSWGCRMELTFGLLAAFLAMPGILRTTVESGAFRGHPQWATNPCVAEEGPRPNSMDLRGPRLCCTYSIRSSDRTF